MEIEKAPHFVKINHPKTAEICGDKPKVFIKNFKQQLKVRVLEEIEMLLGMEDLNSESIFHLCFVSNSWECMTAIIPVMADTLAQSENVFSYNLA